MSDIRVRPAQAIPPRSQRTARWPFGALDVGQSFYVACAPDELDAVQCRLSNRCTWHGKKLGKTFATRREGAGVSVWRTA